MVREGIELVANFTAPVSVQMRVGAVEEAITVSGATITLRITAAGGNADECRQAMQATIDTIHQCLGTLVFGVEEEELEHAVARLLAERPVGVRGLAVPGMPLGSPGMEVPGQAPETYDVIAFDRGEGRSTFMRFRGGEPI